MITKKIKCIECFDKFLPEEINTNMGVNLCKECYKQNVGVGQGKWSLNIESIKRKNK